MEFVICKLDQEPMRLFLNGIWRLTYLNEIKKNKEKITSFLSTHFSTGSSHIKNIIFDGQSIETMDTAGAWLIDEWKRKLISQGCTLQLENFSDNARKLLNMVEQGVTKSLHENREHITELLPPRSNFSYYIAQFGRAAVQQVIAVKNFLSFSGELAIAFMQILFYPSRWRWRALVNVLDKTGLQALPIIALLSFMIGIVIAYQMGNQLRNYGANIFIVNLLGLSILREFGPLMTAIMVAGRTGSAFTAQLGTMKINQEMDALTTMGVPPAQLLLLPRLMGLVISLPLLTMWANFFGVIGGIVMAENMLGISWHEFLSRFQHEIPLRALFIGLGKTPIFALLIASIGCFQGMQTQGSADSVGKQTTRSVVLSIFFIIIADAIFSIVFSRLGL